LFLILGFLFLEALAQYNMQRGREGQDGFFHSDDLLGGVRGFGSHGSLMPSLFGDRDPFDDPFFTRPFGSLFDFGRFGSSDANSSKDQTSRAKGITIEELNSDDEGQNEEDEGTGAENDNRQKHSRSSKEPSVEHPDDDADGNCDWFTCTLCVLFVSLFNN
jgi:hypothetical protein